MRPIARASAGFVLSTASMLTASLLSSGCGDSPPSVETSNTEATVKGIVTVNTVPAKEGELIFNPSNYKRPDAAPRTTKIDSTGAYSIKTLVGENTVKFGGSLARQNPTLQYKQKIVNVKSGENTFDISVETK